MSPTNAVNLCDYIRDIPDFPKPGIVFKDISPLLADGGAFSASVSQLACLIPQETDVIVGIEARGFIFGAALAAKLGIGFVPVRKPGKLPGEVH
ncbi:purine phosphoribosyltransferase family protein, partial [Pseudomonadota bacterium]